MKNIPFSQKELNELFFFDKNSGFLIWKNCPSNKNKNGKRAGCKLHNGYRRVKIGGEDYKEHRIIWIMHYNQQPKEFIDHINGIKDDNRIQNLREATNSQNVCNSRTGSRNNTGVKGVYYNSKRKRYTASCCLNGESKFLGSFIDIVDAENAVKNYREILHKEFTNHG